jgi:hypothetical protein
MASNTEVDFSAAGCVGRDRSVAEEEAPRRSPADRREVPPVVVVEDWICEAE